MSNERREEGSALRKVQLQADAVGIVEEELRVAGTRHDTLAEFYASRLQALAHALDVGRSERDVIEAASILVFLRGSAHHDAFARLARPHQMHGGLTARIKPAARETERRGLCRLPPPALRV